MLQRLRPKLVSAAAACAAVVVGCDGPLSPDAGSEGPAFEVRVDDEGRSDPALAPDLSFHIPNLLPEGVEVVPLEGLSLDEEGRSWPITVASPEAPLMVAVVSGAGETVGLRSATVGAEVLVEDVAADAFADRDVRVARGVPGSFFSPSRAVAAIAVGAALVPSDDRSLDDGDVELTVGEWVVRTEGGVSVSPGAGPVSAAVVRSPEPETERGRLSLVLHYALDEEVQSYAGDAALGPAVERLQEIYAAVGITVEVEDELLVDTPGFQTVTLDESDCARGDLYPLLAEGTAGGSGTALHVFFIERFSCVVDGVDFGANFSGLAGHIPVPGPLVGTGLSGVAVALANTRDDPTTLGLVMAHEIGHALGLFHTQENLSAGSDVIYDPISDTPTFETADNLMFYLASSRTDLSEGQARVMRRHPLVVDEEQP